MISLKRLSKLAALIFAAQCLACVDRGAVLTPNTLKLQMAHEPATLDLSLIEDGASFRFLSALMTGLVSYDENYHLKFEIAETMEVLNGGKLFRFKLRPWKWSDGKQVSSKDFLYAMRRTLDPATPAKLADLLFFIKGARAFKSGQNKDFATVGIQAPDDSTLEFSLDQPVRFFPQILTLSVGLPQREDLVTSLGARWPEKMLSTGPYKISSWVHEQRIELVRNEHYPAFDPLAPARLVFQMVSEEATAMSLFDNQKLDVLSKVPELSFEKLSKKDLIRQYPYFATYYLAFDQRQPPWQDRNARLAIAHAIDRTSALRALAEHEIEATSWIPPALPGSNPSIGFKFDPQMAQSLWNKLGSDKPTKVVLGFDSGARNQTIVEKIQADLKSVLKLNLELRQRDWKSFLRELAVNPAPIYRFGWLAPFVDAYADLMVFQSDNPNNYTGWKSKTYDDLLKQIAAKDSRDPARQKLIDRAQRLLVEEAVVVVPIFHYMQSLVVSKNVKVLPINGLGVIDYMRVRLEK